MSVANSFHGLMHKIGRYQVEHELGRGAMGVVYRAFDPAIGRRIAIKTIRLDQIRDETERGQLRARLLREAQSAGVLSHPNIVTIYDISEDANNAYIFMEYVEGTTLDVFARGMPTADLIAILTQAAEALDYAHARGIVHRDIKPGNLMLSGGQVKIADFGIARFADRDSTQTGGLLGTPGYMSPEQIAGGAITGAADQYGLGVVAYEFLAGAKPFENDNLANLLFRITQQPVPPVATLNAATNQILARVLAKAPEHRYPNCSAFVTALGRALELEPPRHTPNREAVGDEPTLIVSALPEPPVIHLPSLNLPPPPPPSRWKAILGVLVVLVAIGGWIWYEAQSSVEVPLSASLPGPAAPPPDPKPSPMDEPVRVAPPVVASEEPQSPVEATPPRTVQPSPPVSPPATVTHAVNFASAPEGAEFLINGGEQDRCPSAPCSLDLPAGEYEVTARLAGYPEVRRNLRVPSQLGLRVTFEKPEGTVIVNSNPVGAQVRVNGRDSGQRTPAVLKLPPGTYTLEVVKEGLSAQSREITVRIGVVQTLSIQWNQD